MKRFLVLFLAVLLALLATQVAFALGNSTQGETTSFEFPPALEIALVGALSAYVTQGLKNRFPKIANALAVLISAVVSTALGILTGIINTGVPPLLWPLLTQGAIALATWLTSIAVFKVHIQPNLWYEPPFSRNPSPR